VFMEYVPRVEVLLSNGPNRVDFLLFIWWRKQSQLSRRGDGKFPACEWASVVIGVISQGNPKTSYDFWKYFCVTNISDDGTDKK
jgi:hypothetical protein